MSLRQATRVIPDVLWAQLSSWPAKRRQTSLKHLRPLQHRLSKETSPVLQISSIYYRRGFLRDFCGEVTRTSSSLKLHLQPPMTCPRAVHSLPLLLLPARRRLDSPPYDSARPPHLKRHHRFSEELPVGRSRPALAGTGGDSQNSWKRTGKGNGERDFVVVVVGVVGGGGSVDDAGGNRAVGGARA
eukprot:768188-Hanusia_phi.AAC.10